MKRFRLKSIFMTSDAARLSQRRRASLLTLLVVCAAVVWLLLPDARSAAITLADDEEPPFSFATTQGAPEKFSKFSHREAAHLGLPCLLCHRRETTAAQPARPGHIPCAGCHAEPFANSSSPICTICHTNPTAAKPDVKAFPKLSSFSMKFDHSKHRNTACSTCHQPTGRNRVAFSIPQGFAAHTVCYQCHSTRAQSGERDISSCGTCHQLGSYTRMTTSARAFQVNFSHAKHGRSQQLACSDCHQVKAGVPQRQQVSAPLAAQHAASARGQSCMSCHNGKRAFGGDDFKSCQRCHTGQTFRFQ